MSNVQGSRNDFLLGISLSEISFIFFMLLVLITLYSVNKSKKELENSNKELAEAKSELTEAKSTFKDSDDVIGKLKNKLKENEERLEKATNELKKTNKDLKFFKDVSQDQALIIQQDKKYIKELLDNLGLSKSEIKEFQTKLVNVSKLKNDIYVLEKELKQIEKFKKKYKLTELEINDIFKQYSEIRNEIKSAGLDGSEVTKMIKELKKSGGKWHDLPPCFYTPRKATIKKSDKKEDYMYKINVFEKSFHLTPIWKDKDQKAMELIWGKLSNNKIIVKKSSALSRAKFKLNIDEFKIFGAIIREDADLNNCHHHALINDATGDSKKIWKRNLDIIEDYFYKYICVSGC